MNPVNKYSLFDLSKLINHKVRFTSDCEFFPNFDVICKIKKVHMKGNEILFEVNTVKNNKHLTIGSNMKNLQFELQ